MCAIVDADVVAQVFGNRQCKTEAARSFFLHVSSGKLVLVVGGKLKKELLRVGSFRSWFEEAAKSGKIHSVPDFDVNREEQQLIQSTVCKSNDTHVVALAKVSGARLLYTDDALLIHDFKNRSLIATPKGRVYRTPGNGQFSKGHRQLLENAKCRVQ